MIYGQTLKTLSEEELSILFLICEKFFEPIHIPVKYDFLKMLRVDVVSRMLDVLQRQAVPEKQDVFSTLKKKLTE